MTKYRIRLTNGRVIGPFEKNQLFELKTKGHIKGDEEAQVFPIGNWKSIKEFDFYPELMNENKTAINAPVETKEDTFIIDLTKLRTQKQEKDLEEYDQTSIEPVEQLTETIQMSTAEKKVVLDQLEEIIPETKKEPTAITLTEQNLELEEAEDSDSSNKTLINPIAQQEIEKIRRQLKAEEERKVAEEAERLKAEEEAKKFEVALAQENAPVSADESTQMIKLDKTGLLETAQAAEQDIEEELKVVRKRKEKEEAQRREEDGEDEDDEDVDATKSKKKKIILAIAGLAILYAIFFPEEKPKNPPFQHLDPKIVFPIPFDKADSLKSKAEFNKGIKYFSTGTYPGLIKAGISFKNSYENDLENAAALNLMVRTYAEQLKNSKEQLLDAQTLFNLIQSKRPFLVQDPNGVIGLNLFYMAIDKPSAAIDVVQKYLKLNPKNVTQDLFAVYVMSLIKKGKVDVARQFYQALLKPPEKSIYTYTALIEYLLLNQEGQKALEYADEALKRFPKLASLYLLKAELLIKQNSADAAIPLLKKAEELSLDYNNRTRAKFFELKGLVYGLKNKPAEAAKYLGYSLKLYDTNELRMKLADLNTSGGAMTEVDKLINESKAIKHYLQAQDFFNKKNYELAMSSAARATDAFPGYIPAELFLAKVQLKLGLAQEGLRTLEGLVSKYPEDKSINLALIQAYIDTYKFHDAKNRIQIISTADYRDGWEYASVNARLFLTMGDNLQAMSWLKNSISLNPLNDEDLFILSEILIKKASFDAARAYLVKCMELDPVNPDYRIAYARLIYETQDDRAAIGYLLSLQDDFGDNAKVLSEIAIFYYRSGQIKAFQDYKAKLEKHHSKDKALYEFLIKAALLDERHSEIPPLVEKYLAIEPGDLEKMMIAGRVLFEGGKLVDAAKWFKRVQERLPSYPKVLYYIAKIDFLSGDMDGAMKKIKEDMKANGENDVDLVFMAQIHLEKEEYVEAENLFKKAQKLNPRSYDAIVGLADLSTKRNNHDIALNLYKRATKLKADEAMVHKKIGDVYRQIGQGALAIESYKLYLEMDPESPHKKNLENYINLMK
ncbi:MAG: tetratricopeptide repeat protein [Bacteriovoracia bacterium]